MSHDDLVRRALHLLTQPIETVKTEETLKRQPTLAPILTAQPSDRITWIRAGSVQHGTVDFVHIDGDGIAWAFVTLGNSWTTINMKFVIRSGDA